LSGGGIYLIQDGGELVEMAEQPYDSEDLLQGLLAEYPDLLAGDQVNGDEPRRWLLVSREVPLSSEKDGVGRWSVDHLFLDQDAVPTIVEVKRSTDTRIRREVVGQMLDYAANAVVYWSIEELRARFDKGREDSEQELREFLGEPDGDPEGFWREVKTNLQAGKVRLVFVADEIPVELRRVVEFLNGQMDPTEVLAVEIKQYVGDGVKALVPRVMGQTVEAQRKKAVVRKKVDEASFFAQLEANRSAGEAVVARRILEWARSKADSIEWGSSSFNPILVNKGDRHRVVGVYSDGSVEIKFAMMQDKPPFEEVSRRQELAHMLNEIPGVEISADAVTDKRPSFKLSVLESAGNLDRFLGALDWAFREIEGA
jgi:hypothetical protein